MSIHIEVTDNINKIIESVNAEREKVEKATVRALNKTALVGKVTSCQTS